jgi:hypothetical protein
MFRKYPKYLAKSPKEFTPEHWVVVAVRVPTTVVAHPALYLRIIKLFVLAPLITSPGTKVKVGSKVVNARITYKIKKERITRPPLALM